MSAYSCKKQQHTNVRRANNFAIADSARALWASFCFRFVTLPASTLRQVSLSQSVQLLSSFRWLLNCPCFHDLVRKHFAQSLKSVEQKAKAMSSVLVGSRETSHCSLRPSLELSPFFHCIAHPDFLFQTVDGAMSWTSCPQAVSQAPQRTSPSQTPATCGGCFAKRKQREVDADPPSSHSETAFTLICQAKWKKKDDNEKNEMVFFECLSSKTSERLTFSQLSTEHHGAFSTTQSLVVSACETAACFGFPAASCSPSLSLLIIVFQISK